MGGSKSKPSTCELTAYTQPNGWGNKLHIKMARNDARDVNAIWNLAIFAKHMNDDIQSIYLTGPDCWMQACEHPNFKGKCITWRNNYWDNFWWGEQMSNTISSIRMGYGDNVPVWIGRRLDDQSEEPEPETVDYGIEEPGHASDDGVDHTSDPRTRHPLCEALHEGGFETNWQMFSNTTRMEQEVKKMAKSCETEVTDAAETATCKFFVYAGLDILKPEDILAALRMTKDDDTDQAENEHCEAIKKELLEKMEQGEVSGVDLMTIDGEAFFVLDTPVNDETEAETDGARYAALIGETLIKVSHE